MVHRRDAESAETFFFCSIGRYRLTKTTQAFGQKFCTFSLLGFYTETFFSLGGISRTMKTYNSLCVLCGELLFAPCLPLFLSFIQHSMLDVRCSMFIFLSPSWQKQLSAYDSCPMPYAPCPMPFGLIAMFPGYGFYPLASIRDPGFPLSSHH